MHQNKQHWEKVFQTKTPEQVSWKRIKNRKNFNNSVFQKLKKLQLPLNIKRNRSDYVIKNNFKKESARKNVKHILTKIL